MHGERGIHLSIPKLSAAYFFILDNSPIRSIVIGGPVAAAGESGATAGLFVLERRMRASPCSIRCGCWLARRHHAERNDFTAAEAAERSAPWGASTAGARAAGAPILAVSNRNFKFTAVCGKKNR